MHRLGQKNPKNLSPSSELQKFANTYHVPDKSVDALILSGVTDPRILEPEDVEELGLPKLMAKTLKSAIARFKDKAPAQPVFV